MNPGSRTRNFRYAWSLTPALCVIAGNLAGGWWVGLNTFFSLILLAILELFVPEDRSNKPGEGDWFPDGLLLTHVVMQILSLSSAGYALAVHQFTWAQLALMGLSVGVHSGSSAIVIAHELIHRNNKVLRALGQFLLFTAGNTYFYIDHLRVHHKWVGTPKDPATARKNEHLYGFFIRSVAGQVRSSFAVEADRLRRAGRSPWSLSNYITGAFMVQIAWCGMLFLTGGYVFLFVYLFQAFVANFLLEYTNYIEHYGLTRGENERVSELHSWQSDKLISRYFLIDLSRHADHHYYASRPYHRLIRYERSPVLPHGYVSMIYFALIPPVFFRVVNPLLKQEPD